MNQHLGGDMNGNDKNPEFLHTLEEVKKQYEDFLKISGIFDLPTFQEGRSPPPPEFSPENPLTRNKFVLDKREG